MRITAKECAKIHLQRYMAGFLYSRTVHSTYRLRTRTNPLNSRKKKKRNMHFSLLRLGASFEIGQFFFYRKDRKVQKWGLFYFSTQYWCFGIERKNDFFSVSLLRLLFNE